MMTRKPSGRVTPKGTQPKNYRNPMSGLAAKAFEMQAKIAEAREAAAEAEVVGTAGGGAVTITLRGDGTPVAVKIKPEAVDLEDLSLLEDLVSIAIGDANDKATKLRTDLTEGQVGEDLDLDALGLSGILG